MCKRKIQYYINKNFQFLDLYQVFQLRIYDSVKIIDISNEVEQNINILLFQNIIQKY
jgi:hypothetical protein